MPTRRVIGRRCPQGRRVARAPSGCAWALALVAALGPQPGLSQYGTYDSIPGTLPAGTGDGGTGTTSPPSSDGGRHGGGGGGNWVVPAIVVGAAALAVISHMLSQEATPEGPGAERSPVDQDLLERLRREGPQFAPQYNMSAFAARGIVQGGWPLVFDFEQRSKGQVRLSISAQGVPEVFTFPLERKRPGRYHVVMSVPQEIGAEPRPALIAVTATEMDGQTTLPGFKVYGLGAGARAVGSVAIDHVLFQPPSIRARKGQTAAYRFFSHSDFGNASVEFMRVSRATDGSRLEYVNDQLIEAGVRKDQWIGDPERREWNGTDGDNRVSPGPHKLRVRAWDYAGDWVTAWSDSVVTVRE